MMLVLVIVVVIIGVLILAALCDIHAAIKELAKTRQP
jgi:hypothetical protein